MNGRQLHLHLLAHPNQTAREIVALTGMGKPWNVRRECRSHCYIYVSGWAKEFNVRTRQYELEPRWSAFLPPEDAPLPTERTSREAVNRSKR